MGGHASTEAYDPDTGESSFGPTLEKNPNDGQDSTTRPMNSFNDAKLKQQGLAGDLVRGHSQSTARRESPSKVFGMTTAGGHVLTMDDGAADLGEVATQIFAMEVPAYPRAPEAQFDDHIDADDIDEKPPSPFAALAALKTESDET